MPSLFAQRNRTRQPSGQVGANPEWSSLRVLATGDFSRNIAAPTTFTRNNIGVVPVASRHGRGLDFSANTGGILVNSGPDSGAITLVAVCALEGSGGGGLGRLMSTYNSAGTGGFDIYTSSSNTVIFNQFWSGGTVSWNYGLTYSTEINTYCWTMDASATANNPILYVNGSKVTLNKSGTASGTRYISQGVMGIGRAVYSTARMLDGKVFLAAYLAEDVGESGAQSLSTNPWKLFAPEPATKIFLPSLGQSFQPAWASQSTLVGA